MLIKIVLIQHLEGIRSVRETCKQIKSNATYRCFLGLGIYQNLPNHSTISQFLWKRLKGEQFWLNLFNHDNQRIHRDGFIANKTLAADKTVLLANVYKRKRIIPKFV